MTNSRALSAAGPRAVTGLLGSAAANDLGATTEARVALASAAAALITRTGAASLMAIDETSLDRLSETGAIQTVPWGRA